MGQGPLHLLENGIVESVHAQEHEVENRTVLLSNAFYSEGQALVQLQGRAVPLLRQALAKKRRVLLLSGNCGVAALSAAAALGPRTIGVVWFDAHGDFNTPETSASGFLDGMALSILTGRCWPALAASFDTFEPVPESNVVFVGGHALDPAEKQTLAGSAITHVKPADLDRLESAIENLSARVERLYIHLDVDVLDAAEGQANTYARRGGLPAEALYSALKIASRHARVSVASITAYDPACDGSGNVQQIIRH